jgi:uncharacterized protein (DUF2164 family)
MQKIDSQLSLLAKEKRQQAINGIVGYFQTERSEEIGVIAAEAILDFFLEEIGKTVYNKGVKDARSILEQRLGDFGIDLEALILEESPR